MVHRVYQSVAGPAKIPIIGMGGIQDWRDAVAFLLAGATAVGIGTALFVDPTGPLRVISGIEAYLARQRAGSVTEIVGRCRSRPASGPGASVHPTHGFCHDERLTENS
jgi:dihydroorotate dehydrogenase (NAD+) catalytic subunit